MTNELRDSVNTMVLFCLRRKYFTSKVNFLVIKVFAQSTKPKFTHDYIKQDYETDVGRERCYVVKS